MRTIFPRLPSARGIKTGLSNDPSLESQSRDRIFVLIASRSREKAKSEASALVFRGGSATAAGCLPVCESRSRGARLSRLEVFSSATLTRHYPPPSPNINQTCPEASHCHPCNLNTPPSCLLSIPIAKNRTENPSAPGA